MKTWLKRAAAAVLSLSLLAAPVLAAAETAGSSTLNLSDNTVYTYSTQSVTSDSGKQTNLHENIFTYRKEAQVRPVVAFGSTLYGTSAMNKTIKTLEEQGYRRVLEPETIVFKQKEEDKMEKLHSIRPLKEAIARLNR